MKRAMFLVLALACVLSFSAVSFAEEESLGAKEGKTHHKKGEMKCMMMKKMMMQKEMVATNDGGVVVLFGKKLMKYDKNLNLIL